MRLTPSQLRAARGLLDLTQEALAERAGVALDSVKKFENGRTRKLQDRSERAMIRVLEEGGVEFLDNDGTRRRDDVVRVLEGKNAYLRFLDELYYAVHDTKDEVLFLNVDDSISSPAVVEANLRIRNAGVPCRYLCEENPKRLDFPVEDYRGIPSEFFRNGLQIVYKDSVAMLFNSLPRVLILKNEELADSIRKLFEMVWLTHSLPEPRGQRNGN
jgi:transcriptional regulator with XRE-family HTH domain